MKQTKKLLALLLALVMLLSIVNLAAFMTTALHEGEHTFNTEADIPAAGPTCTQPGHGKGWICTQEDCNYVSWEDGYTPALGHIDEDGNDVCERCGEHLNHVFTNYVSDNNATCIADGTKTAVCDVCGKAKDTIPDEGSSLFASHKYEWTEMNDETCIENRHRKGICKLCGTEVMEEIPYTSLGHTEGDWLYPEGFDCEVGGYRYKECIRCHETMILDEVEGCAHSGVIDPEVPKTCTTDGKSAGMHCEICGKIIFQQVIFPAEGHKSNENGFIIVTEATCTTDGLKTATCGLCGTDFTEIIPASGHRYDDLVVEPNCESVGYTLHKCATCGFEEKDNFIIPLGHMVAIDAAVPATCQQSGRTEGAHCTRCGKRIVAQEVIAKTDHTDADDDGVCDNCGTVLREPQPQEEPQGFFAKIVAFFRNLFDRIFGIFRR